MKIATKKYFPLLSALLCAIMTLTMVEFSHKQPVFNAETTNFAPTITAMPNRGEEINILDGDILEYASAYALGKSAKIIITLLPL
ncbi:MAG: hypothetical protein IJY84_02215 [Clostridia bacterium]|nr:hypothetical protein [Clostridia bacterium]